MGVQPGPKADDKAVLSSFGDQSYKAGRAPVPKRIENAPAFSNALASSMIFFSLAGAFALQSKSTQGTHALGS